MARLPIPGSDDDQWGTILNTFLDVEHNSDGTLKPSGSLAGKVAQTRSIIAGIGLNGGGDLSADRTLNVTVGSTSGTIAAGDDARFTSAIPKATISAKGDLVAGSAASTPARLPVGNDGQMLTASSAASLGVTWVDQPLINNDSATYPLSGYGLVAATDVPQLFGSSSAVSSGDLFITRMWVPAYTAFSKMALAVRDKGTYTTSTTPNQLALYDDSGTLLQTTADDSTIWVNNEYWYTASLPAPVGAQAAGRFVYVGFIVGGYNGVSPAWNNSSNTPLLSLAVDNTHRRTMYAGARTSFPSSFDSTSFGQLTNYIPLMGLMT